MHVAPTALLLLALIAQEPAAKKPSVFPTTPPQEPSKDAAQPTTDKQPLGADDPSILDRAQAAKEYFAITDYDEDGRIDFREAEEALAMTRTSFRQYDKDVDGWITFEEFEARYNELLDRTGGFPKPKAQGPAPTLGPPATPVPGPGANMDDVLSTLPPAPAPAVTPESFVNTYDLNVDGRLSALEVGEASKALGFGGLSGQAILSLLDADGSTFVEPAELSQALAALGLLTTGGTDPNAPKAKSVEELFGHAVPRDLSPGATPMPPHIAGPVRPFRRLDLDDDGVIQAHDLHLLSVSAHPRVSPFAVIATLDLDGDGALSPEEFAEAFDD
jgi:Ca2+-binding EF-hand superfamily protein